MKKIYTISKKLRSADSFINIGANIFASKFFNIRKPLLVSWEITSKCDSKCTYCGFSSVRRKDLPLAKIIYIIDHLKKNGTKILSLTGGEPLLRKDITEIVAYAVSKGIKTGINTNGYHLQNNLSILKYVNSITLSLDGNEIVNDKTRGRGAFKYTLNAAEIIKSFNKPLRFTTVLNKFNTDQIDYLIAVTKKYNAKIMFQPAYPYLLRKKVLNSEIPEKNDYIKAVEYLIKLKKFEPVILNSEPGLQMLLLWPTGRPMFCGGGRFFVKLLSDGNTEICGMAGDTSPAENSVFQKGGILSCMKNINRGLCSTCWCARRTELNLAYSFNYKAIFNLIYE